MPRYLRRDTDNTNEENGGGRVSGSNLSLQEKRELEENREALVDLRDLISRGHDGDQDALAKMDTVLEQIPSIARRFGNLNIMVEEGL